MFHSLQPAAIKNCFCFSCDGHDLWIPAFSHNNALCDAGWFSPLGLGSFALFAALVLRSFLFKRWKYAAQVSSKTAVIEFFQDFHVKLQQNSQMLIQFLLNSIALILEKQVFKSRQRNEYYTQL